MPVSSRLPELLAEARYHRQRHDLYRAKMYAGRPASAARLRELARAAEGAEARLRHAQRQERSPEPADGG